MWQAVPTRESLRKTTQQAQTKTGMHVPVTAAAAAAAAALIIERWLTICDRLIPHSSFLIEAIYSIIVVIWSSCRSPDEMVDIAVAITITLTIIFRVVFSFPASFLLLYIVLI